MIQPPIMKAPLRERAPDQDEPAALGEQREKIAFLLVVLIAVVLFLPDAAPLLGMFCFGNLMRECGVVERLSDTAQNALINIVTIFLGLSVGSKLMADKFLDAQTLGILALGIVAFGIGTARGLLMAKLMNKFTGADQPADWLCRCTVVPMAARVSNKVDWKPTRRTSRCTPWVRTWLALSSTWRRCDDQALADPHIRKTPSASAVRGFIVWAPGPGSRWG